MNHHTADKLMPASRAAGGFTLLELLMVVAIISLLMGLSFVAMFGLTDQAREEATTTTIRKVDALLQQRIEAFDRAFKGNRRQFAINGITAVLAGQNIHGVRDEVKVILAKKALFRYEFPQRMEERLLFGDPSTIVPGLPDSIFRTIAAPNARQFLINENQNEPTPPGPNPAFVPTEAQVQNLAATRWAGGSFTIEFTAGNPRTFNFSGHRPETQSSALLYFTLTASESYGVSSVDADRFTNEEVADTDGDGLPEFIDAWEQPLRFYRWPTRLIDIDAPSPFQPILTNLTDPTDLRVIEGLERELAELLFKGLSPPPLPMPNGVLPRDLLLTDPDDPVGRLYAELERLDGTDGKPLFRNEFNEIKYHTPDTYHTPLIVSAGGDGELGLWEPTDYPNPLLPDTGIRGNLAQLEGTTVFAPLPTAAVREKLLDNITNRNRRSGGRR